MMTKEKNPKAIKNWAEDERPREKMEQKGAEALSNAELLAILIQSGTARRSALELAREILQLGNDDLGLLGRLSIKDFQTIPGIGSARSISISAALELGRRRQVSESMKQKLINSSKQAAELLLPHMRDLSQERFIIMCMAQNGRLLHWEMISSGGVTGTVVDTKILFKIALRYLASNIIVAHNHPSGSLKPSQADIQITGKIKDAATFLDIHLMDHIIIADRSYYSFADHGML